MVKSVMIVIRHLIYGGTERYALNLANSLAEQGVRVAMVSGDGPLKKQVSPKVNLFIMPIRRTPRTRLIAEKRILDIAREYKPQIIHTQCRTSMLNSQLARNSLNIPLVTHEHHMYDPQDYPFIVDEIRSGADHILTVGPYAAEALAKNGLDKESITTILNGIDIKKNLPLSQDERDKTRREFRISSTDKVILCLSRLEPGKGIDKLALSFVDVAKAIPEAKLFIVGDDMTTETDAYVKKIVDTFHLQNQLFRLKGDQNIRKYHAIADVFCYPALAKGMAVMEAMAAELPVVGKKTVRKPLMVEHGISGLMTEPSAQLPIDPEELSKKLIYLLTHPKVAKKMGKAGRRKIEKEYTFDRVIRQTLEVYKETIDTHSLRRESYNSSQASPIGA